MSQSTPPAPATNGALPHQHTSTVVCGIDGSPGCVEVARIATTLAHELPGRAELVHVLDGRWAATDSVAVTELRFAAEAMLDGLCDSSGPLATGRLVESGDPARRIAAIAESERAGLIVVGTRGNARVVDPLLGSVSSRLAADAPCPVLIVPPALQSHIRPDTWRGRTIVCGYDGSDNAWNAAVATCLLAARLEADVHLVSIGTGLGWRVDETASLLREMVVDQLDPAGHRPEIDAGLRLGDPAWELERVARALTAPLLVIGSRGQGPRRDALLGSVCRRVLLAARRPILVCPATS